ncbi:hypothetical protein ACFQ60_32745 [Streptomyces zhihengii]
MGRATAAVFAVAGVEQWRTTTVHEGDRTHSVPPQGGVVSTSLTDVDGQVTEQRQYQSGSPLSAGPSSYTSTRYTYTPSGQLATVTDAQQNAWSFEYDQRGRKVKSVDPDAGTTITGYDDADRVVSVRHEGRGTEVTTAYDAVGRATATYDGPVSAGKKLTENRYDRSGALGKQYASLRYTGATEYFGTAVQEFDDQYRPMKTAHIVPASEGALAGTYLFTNTYNRDGTVQSAGLPAAGGLAAEVIRYGYDELQRPVTMEGLSTYVTGTTWSPTTDLLQLELNTGGKKVWQTFDYERAPSVSPAPWWTSRAPRPDRSRRPATATTRPETSCPCRTSARAPRLPTCSASSTTRTGGCPRRGLPARARRRPPVPARPAPPPRSTAPCRRPARRHRAARPSADRPRTGSRTGPTRWATAPRTSPTTPVWTPPRTSPGPSPTARARPDRTR